MFLVCFLKTMHPLVNKDVLVIVPTHSRDHTFSYTVESILNQSYKNFNLAIIGDGVDDEYKKNIQKIDYSMEFQHTDPIILELMDKMIQFNPYFRARPADLVKSKIFDKIRKPEMEVNAEKLIEMKFDEKG